MPRDRVTRTRDPSRFEPPARRKIYHITHVDNLARIVEDGGLVCDRIMIERGGPQQSVGMSEIKRRRVEKLSVGCHPGTRVGDYVPFYFCPRSVMLYVLYCGNHPGLDYTGGQEPIVHLEADLHRVIQWADAESVPWAFSLSNAGAYYTELRSRVNDLGDLDWSAIAARDFRDPGIKERKQAEFLIHDRLPFPLIERIGVRSEPIRSRTAQAIADGAHRPRIEIRSDWYF